MIYFQSGSWILSDNRKYKKMKYLKMEKRTLFFQKYYMHDFFSKDNSKNFKLIFQKIGFNLMKVIKSENGHGFRCILRFAQIRNV